jgi:hypothetical protein
MNRIIVIAALVSVCFCGNTRADLLVNGGFETGDFSGWTVYPNPPGDDALIISSGQFPGENRVSDGNYGVDFNFNHLPATAILSQTFATVPGNAYSLSFDFGSINASGKLASVALSVLDENGSTPLISRAISVIGNAPTKWESFTDSFIADGSSATIRFTDTTPDSYACDGLLDKVSVQSVPEPSTLALLVAGAMGVALFSRKKRRG